MRAFRENLTAKYVFACQGTSNANAEAFWAAPLLLVHAQLEHWLDVNYWNQTPSDTNTDAILYTTNQYKSHNTGNH